jgi:hypothetical protein
MRCALRKEKMNRAPQQRRCSQRQNGTYPDRQTAGNITLQAARDRFLRVLG